MTTRSSPRRSCSRRSPGSRARRASSRTTQTTTTRRPGGNPAGSRPGSGGGAGQERAARLEQILHNARENPDLTIDVVQVLRRTPDLGRRYAALLLEEGAMPDAQAAEELRAPESEVTAAAEALDRVLRGLSG